MVVEKGLKGTENQCVGVAEALGVTPEIKHFELRQPWKTLTPYIGFECGFTFKPAFKPPYPDVVIAGGRKSVAALRYIEHHTQSRVFSVFLQNPKIPSTYFDLVCAPKHDRLEGKNVIETIGAPNRVTHDLLVAEREKLPQFTAEKKTPKVAVLIGGKSKHHSLSLIQMKAIIRQLQKLDARLMITASRRTGRFNKKLLHKAKFDNAYIWNGKGENPYFAMLDAADFIICTDDSVSMLSEACSTGKPVYIIPLEGGSEKISRFLSLLKEQNMVRDFEGKLESWSYVPLMDATLVAQEIGRRLTQREEFNERREKSQTH